MKRILFITTKNLDYLRNVQEIEKLKMDYDVNVVGYMDKSYIKRLIKIYLKLIRYNIRDIDSVFI